jgi:hypothetical protein
MTAASAHRELEAAGAAVLDLRPTEWRELAQQAA